MTLVFSAAPVALWLLAACGGRSDISPFGTGGTGGGSSHASVGSTSAMSSSSTGAPLHCDPPKQKAVIVTDKLQAPLEVLSLGDYIYVLEKDDVVQISNCGGPAKILANNMLGMSSTRGFSVRDGGIRWGMSGGGSGALGFIPLGGGAFTFKATESVLSVDADAQGNYAAFASGGLAGFSTAGSTTLASTGPVAYWAPLVVHGGWVYWTRSTDSVFGQMVRVRTDGTNLQSLVSLRIPDDIAVEGDQVFTVTAHGVDELQSFDAKSPQLSAVAVVHSPIAIAVDAKHIYIADAIGVERAPLDASTVTPLVGQVGILDVTVTNDSIIWIADDGTLSWVKKPQ